MARPVRSIALVLIVLATLALRLPATAQQCTGDCNADLVVAVDELVLCTNVGLGAMSLSDCPSCDAGQDGNVTVDDLIASVGSALGLFSLQGICRVPCQGAECDLPEATANGLIPCAEGTTVKVSRCTDRADCLREAAGRTAPGTGMVARSGVFTVRVDACRAAGSLFLLEADLSANGGGAYRSLVSFAPGSAAGSGRPALLGEVVLDPSSEAAVQLLDALGLETFTDEGVVGVIDAVAAANEGTQYANQSPSAAAAGAGEIANEDQRVQDAIRRGRIPSPTASPTLSPTPTATSKATRTPVATATAPTPTGGPVTTPTRTPPNSGVEIEIGSATTAPNSHVTIGVTLNSPSGTDIAGALIDIGFEPGARIAEAMMPMGLLTGSVSATDTAIPVDDVSGLPDFGTVQIDEEMITYGRIDDNVLVVGGCSGGGPGIACIEDSECSGGSCQPSGRGQFATVGAAHDAGAMVQLRTGLPNCRMSPSLNKATIFSFLPSGCTPTVDCDTVRGIVISLVDLEPLPTGETLLYTCAVHAGPVLGTFPLTCEEVQTSAPPDARGFVASTCVDGEIVIRDGVPTETPTPTRTSTTPTTTPPTGSSVAIDIGSASGRPGETVRVDVTLQVANAEVAATDNRITVSPGTPILHCEVPTRFTGFSQVILEPEGCEENPQVACLAARALIINPSIMAIENGALLYSCDIGISPIALPVGFPIVCSEQLASSPEGQPFNGAGRCRKRVSMVCETDDDCASFGGACRILPPTECENGSITVSDGLPPTPTPGLLTPTPTPTPATTPDGTVEIRIGSTALVPNAIGTFDVTLHVGAGQPAVGVLNDVFFADGVTIPARMMTATLLSADIGPDDTAIPVDDATVLPGFGFAQIDDEQVVYVRQGGNVLAVGSCSGGGGICADDTECGAKATCDPSGRGQNGTVPAAHVSGASVEVPTGGPDCVMSPELDALNKDAVFSFLPFDCVPGLDCGSMRAIIISLTDPLNAFPAGDTVLYTCAVQAGAEEGTFPLECGDAQVSGPPDEGLLDATCVDGAVFVHGTICGNGLAEEGEDCDDGSICLPSFQDCTDTGECPNGERCEPVGGDGCARNCTIETVRVATLDPERSGAVIRLGFGGSALLSVPLSGKQVVTTGGVRNDATFGVNHLRLAPAGEVPIVIRADDMSFNPAPVGILVCACLLPVSEPLFGPGLSAVGVAGCGDAGLADISFVVEQDHNTTPGNSNNSGPENGLTDDPNCDAVVDLGGGLTSSACLEGQDEACSAAPMAHGVCNSPRVFTFTGGPAARGATFLQSKTALSLLADGGACDTTLEGMVPCPHEDYGPDCVPCTSDDAAARMIIHNPVTSGTAAAIIYDTRNVVGDVNMITVGPGEPTDCEVILSDPNAPLQGVFVSAFPGLDVEAIGDTTMSTTLALSAESVSALVRLSTSTKEYEAESTE